MPSVKQVFGTLPSAFKDKFQTTYAIIDGSEIFIDKKGISIMVDRGFTKYTSINGRTATSTGD